MPRLTARLERLGTALKTEQGLTLRPWRTHFTYAPPPGHPPGPGDTSEEEAAAEVARLEAEGVNVVHVRFVRAEGAASHPPPAHA